MKYKFRQAKANLAKQPRNPALQKVDPLSVICAERISLIKKTKHINKQMYKQQQRKIQNTIRNEQHKQKNQQIQKIKIRIKNKNNKQSAIDLRNKKNEIIWQKYLPQQCDQFGQKEFTNLNKILQQKPLFPIKQTLKVQKTIEPNLIQGNMNQNTQNIDKTSEKLQYLLEHNFEELKQKLGIGIKQMPPQQIKPKLEEPKFFDKNNSKQAALLPFAGRPFQQAPPRPAPKPIYQYPPVCKVAGLYPWPPPKSQWRSWRNQMKQSRKLT